MRHWFLHSTGYDGGFGMSIPGDITMLAQHPSPSGPAVVPPRLLAHVLLNTVEDCTGIGLKDDRANVPNQLIGNGIAFIRQGLVLDEFRDAESWYDIGVQRTLRASQVVMPDGTHLEYALDYNRAFVFQIDALAGLLANFGRRPEWLRQLQDKSDGTVRMHAALLMPSGVLPSVGNLEYTLRGTRQLMDRWQHQRALAGLADVYEAVYDSSYTTGIRPAFSSIFLPYSGYSTLRSGWDDEALYLFMRSSRPGSGHRHADNNGLHVSAYGRHLLVDGGPPAYGTGGMPEQQRMDNLWFEEKEGYTGSSFSSCTVVVDGLSQKKPGKPDPAQGYGTTVGTRWLTTEIFDFTEGVYRADYRSEDPVSDQDLERLIAEYGRDALGDMIEALERMKRAGKREVDGVHHRQVFFVKELALWIVTDRVYGGEEYTQIWNYPPPHEGENPANFICPGFHPGQVRADEEAKAIRTIDPRGPNIILRHFMAGPIRYEMKYGERYPHRGWFAFKKGAERVPNVQMQASWSGAAPLVTVLKPLRKRHDDDAYEALDTEAVSGFRMTQDGRTLTFLVGRDDQELTAGPIAVVGEALLTVADDVRTVGVVLGCTAMRVDGHPFEPGHPGFQFEVEDSRLRRVEPVIVPAAFRWVATAKGLAPSYD